jgi:hypothetical protein
MNNDDEWQALFGRCQKLIQSLLPLKPFIKVAVANRSCSGSRFVCLFHCIHNERASSSSIGARHDFSPINIPIMFQMRTTPTAATLTHDTSAMPASTTAASVVGRRCHSDGQTHVQQCCTFPNRH